MGPQQSPPGRPQPAAGALVVIGVTSGPSGTTTGPETGFPAIGGGTTSGAPAAGGAGVSATGKTVTPDAEAPCPPTTVPPGRAAAMGGSAARTDSIGGWAHAAVPVNRAALVSHRRIPRMVCLAAVGGRRPGGPVGSLKPVI